MPSPGQSHYSLNRSIFLFLAALMGTFSVVQAAPLDLDALQGLTIGVSSNPDFDEQTQTDLLDRVDTARGLLTEEKTYQGNRDSFIQRRESSAAEVSRIEQELAAIQIELEATAGPIPANATLDDLESRINIIEAERAGLTQRQSEIRERLNAWPQRRDNIQKRLAELKTTLDKAIAFEATGDAPVQDRVTAAVMEAGQRVSTAERESLEQELLSHPAYLAVSSAEAAFLAQSIQLVDRQLKALKAAAENTRAQQVQENLENTTELQAITSDLAPELQAYADRNRELAEELKTYADSKYRAVALGAEMQDELEDIQQDYSLMRRRLEVAGRKDVLGRVMITRLNSLPNTEQIVRGARTRDDLIAEVSLAYIDDDEALRSLGILSKTTTNLSAAAGHAQPSEQLVKDLVEQRKALLERATHSQRDLLKELVKNNERAQNLAGITGEFNRFLIGNLLWVRDFSFYELETLYSQLRAVLALGNWLSLPGDLARGYQQHPWTALMLIAVLLAVLTHRPLINAYSARLAIPALLTEQTLFNIMLCLILVLFVVLPGPLLVYFIGQWLSIAQPTSEFLEALAPATLALATGMYVLMLVRRMIHPLGLGRRLLKWDARLLETVRQELRWAGPLLLITSAVDVFALNLDVVASGGPLGAICTAVIAATMIAFCARLWRDGLIREIRNLRWPLGAVIGLSSLVILLLGLGLLFAAEIYLTSFALSLLFILLIKTLTDVLERALLILRARLERKAREEVKAREEDGQEVNLEVDDLVDVVSLSDAHSKLLNIVRLVSLAVVLWLIWSPSLPAFSLLDSITLWQVTDSSDPAAGMRYVTLTDLVMGILTLVLTVLLAKHLPSLVQVFLLEWVNISAGARYAGSILIQYLVVAVGVSAFLATIGWEWSRLQWLVAALGVGIGFGLQEIVANFISGIIILFERPIRVGDIIGVGGAEGTVKQISARATVLQTFDGKEHLIPNKELITGHVINWSLSNKAIRIVIPVGIAYGSDVRLAMQILLDTAKENPLVLPDPAPAATFEDFGDNSLVLWLRCFVAEERTRTWTELRTVINDRFNEAGIVIAFPQRDLHLDTLSPLQIEIADRPGP